MSNDEELGLLSPCSQSARLRILMLFSYTQDSHCHIEALGYFGGEADCCFPSETVHHALLTPWEQPGQDWARHSEVKHLPCVLAGRNMYLHLFSLCSVYFWLPTLHLWCFPYTSFVHHSPCRNCLVPALWLKVPAA